MTTKRKATPVKVIKCDQKVKKVPDFKIDKDLNHILEYIVIRVGNKYTLPIEIKELHSRVDIDFYFKDGDHYNGYISDILNDGDHYNGYIIVKQDNSFITWLKKLGACEDGIEYARDNNYKSFMEAWEKCNVPSYLIWLAKHTVELNSIINDRSLNNLITYDITEEELDNFEYNPNYIQTLRSIFNYKTLTPMDYEE